MCLAMAAMSSGIGGTALGIGGAVLAGAGACMYQMNDRIKNIFRWKKT